MVLNSKMKKYVLYIVMLLFTVVFSCDENPIFINCHDCTQDEPDHATLILYLEKQMIDWHPAAVIRIYEGNLEDNVLRDIFYAREEKFEVDVPLNKKYTITATYNDASGNNYIAVDTAFPRVKYENSQCENPCYYVYDRIVNLRLKYTK